MNQIKFPISIDNDAAHRNIKLLMRQHKQLNIQLDEEPNAWISSQGVTGLRYQLNNDSWRWLLNYLQTGQCEDFGIFPSDLPQFPSGFQRRTLESLIDSKCNIARIPFLRETQSFIKLRGLFKFGKLFFSIRRTDDFVDYLISKGL